MGVDAQGLQGHRPIYAGANSNDMSSKSTGTGKIMTAVALAALATVAVVTLLAGMITLPVCAIITGAALLVGVPLFVSGLRDRINSRDDVTSFSGTGKASKASAREKIPNFTPKVKSVAETNEAVKEVASRELKSSVASKNTAKTEASLTSSDGSSVSVHEDQTTASAADDVDTNSAESNQQNNNVIKKKTVKFDEFVECRVFQKRRQYDNTSKFIIEGTMPLKEAPGGKVRIKRSSK